MRCDLFLTPRKRLVERSPPSRRRGVRITQVAFGLIALATLSSKGVAAELNLSNLDRAMSGPRSQVLVLGSAHLALESDASNPQALDSLLDRLATYQPDVITIEAISGEGCESVRRYPQLYIAEDFAPYCSDTREAQDATGLDVPTAIAEVNKTLAAWPAHPTPRQRLHLAAYFLAANDDASALTQWLQIPQSDRRASDGVKEAVVRLLDRGLKQTSESYLIGVRLAARLGLQRVFPIDDHTGDNVAVADAKAYGNAISRAWKSAHAQSQPIRDREAVLLKSGDMLALYRYMNRPDVLRRSADGDFGAAMRLDSADHFGQIYVAGWETRNLRMVANVRAAFRELPGARVLSIVGSSHKLWFDQLLGQLQGVDIVDAEKVLGPDSKSVPRAR